MTNTQQAMSIRPEQARRIVEDCIELLGEIMYERTALMALVCPPSAWGQLGSVAAAGTQQWMQQVNQTLLTLIRFHEQMQRLIRTSANLYESEDQNTMGQFRSLQHGLA